MISKKEKYSRRNSFYLVFLLFVLSSSVLAEDTVLVSGSRFVCILDKGKVLCTDLDESSLSHRDNNKPPLFKFEPISGLSDKVTEIVANMSSACALDDNRIKCWQVKRDSYINPTPSTRFTAIEINFSEPISKIAVSDDVGYAISNNKLYQFNPKSVASPIIDKNNLESYKLDGLVFKQNHLCVEASNKILCRGDNSSGELGSAEFIVTKIPPSGNLIECILETFLSAGGGVSRCSLRYTVPSPKPSLKEFVAVRGLPESDMTGLISSGSRTCAKSVQNGEMYCWGKNLQSTRCLDLITVHDDFGNKIDYDKKSSFLHGNCAMPAESLNRFTNLALGGRVSCGLDNGRVWCFSKPDNQLFIAPETQEPAIIQGLPDGVKSFTLSFGETVFALIDDTLWIVPVTRDYSDHLKPPRPIAKVISEDGD